MGLALMLRRHREALECDLAETYGLFDLRMLPARKLATLAMGLRESSRVMMARTPSSPRRWSAPSRLW